MAKPCNFCQEPALQPVYHVPTSRRRICVYVCPHCSLVQSESSSPQQATQRVIAASSDADWGNIRHGKGLRLESNLRIITSRLDFSAVTRVLDVGSNRGSFVQWVKRTHPYIQIAAVEPDRQVIDSYKDLPGIDLRIAPFEKASFPPESFDFVYCSHTLEHAESAAQMLRSLHDIMRPGALLFIEVPDLMAIGAEDIVEEFFIDKHRYHFSFDVLEDYAASCGYSIDYSSSPRDGAHIELVLSRSGSGRPYNPRPALSSLAKDEEQMLSAYAVRLEANRLHLRKVGTRLRALIERQRVAFWGASKLFDALVKHGGLNPATVGCLIDEHLYGVLEQTHGVRIDSPRQLKIFEPQVVIVLARYSAPEIIAKVRSLGIKNVISFADLFASV